MTYDGSFMMDDDIGRYMIYPDHDIGKVYDDNGNDDIDAS